MPARDPHAPIFSALSADECWTVLSRNHVGRLAFVHANRVDIEPVSFAASKSWIFMRSAEGAKLEALSHNPYVAFEVDEVEGPFDWRSVVARGTIYLMSDDNQFADQTALDRAVATLRSFAPQTLTADDPAPFRRTVYGLHVDTITGRMAESDARHSRRAALPVDQAHPPRPRHPDGF